MPKLVSINSKMDKDEREYIEKYGNIPTEKEDILKYIENNFKLNYSNIKEEEERIKNIPWKELAISLPLVPKPSNRPKYNFSMKHFYVKGAANNKKIIKRYLDNSNIIYTRTDLIVITYQPTPTSVMTNNEIYLAEKGLLMPIQNPD
jgi:hypothetical protein